MKRLSNLVGTTIVAVQIAAAGCVPQTRITKLYQDPDARPAPYERVLVIGIATEPDLRRWMEDLLGERLSDQDVAATPGCAACALRNLLIADCAGVI